jgi:restriction system protein
LNKLSQELKGHPLSHFAAQLLEAIGYRTRVSPDGPDGGIDIHALRDELGFEPPTVKVQGKGGDASAGDPAVSALYGKVGSGEFGLVAPLSKFTPAATSPRRRPNMRLIDGPD